MSKEPPANLVELYAIAWSDKLNSNRRGMDWANGEIDHKTDSRSLWTKKPIYRMDRLSTRQDCKIITYVYNEKLDELKNALGICIAAMQRHDRVDIDYESHPASTCLVDFSSEIEIAKKALEE